MPDSSAKGDRRERELVRELDAHGFAVMRAPASGSATERELPDVLAGDGDSFYAIEAKASAADRAIYVPGDEVADLEYFADGFGATALLGARFDRREWYFREPRTCYRTGGGNYRLRADDADDDRSVRLDEL